MGILEQFYAMLLPWVKYAKLRCGGLYNTGDALVDPAEFGLLGAEGLTDRADFAVAPQVGEGFCRQCFMTVARA